MPLTAAQLIEYHEQGFLIFPALISGSKLAHYQRVGDEIVAAARERAEDEHWRLEHEKTTKAILPGRLQKLQSCAVVEPRFLELVSEPTIVALVRALLPDAAELDAFGTKFFPRLPGGNNLSTDWHQDNYYFGTDSDRIVTCGIYLQDVDVDNGCLRLVPQSHRQGAYVHSPDDSGYGDWAQVDESAAFDVICPAGTVVLFSANLLHGARENTSDRTRYSTAWHYLPGDFDLPPFSRGSYADRHVVWTG